MIRRVRLSGELAERYGAEWDLDIATPGEAFHAIDANRPGFLSHVLESERNGISHAVLAEGRLLAADELLTPSSTAELQLVPVVTGAKKEQLGFALVALGITLQFSPFILTGIPQYLTVTGFALIGSGLARLFAPIRSPDEQRDEGGERSTHFSGPVNTIGQGFPVPLCYGRLVIGSATISMGIRAIDKE